MTEKKNEAIAVFAKAILAVDFSPATDALMTCLPQLDEMGVRETALVYVFDINYPHAPELEHINHYRQRLSRLGQALAGKGMTFSSQVRIGDPATELLQAAAENGAELMVMGSQGHGRLEEALLGSVATAVARKAVLPLLLLPLKSDREGTCRLTHKLFLRNLLLATDFSETAEGAFRLLQRIAGLFESVTLLHVQSGEIEGMTPEERDKADLIRLEQMRAKLGPSSDFPVRVRLEHGRPGPLIVDIAAETEASLLLIGSRGRGLIKEILLGSVSRHLLRHSGLPVLLFPEGARHQGTACEEK